MKIVDAIGFIASLVSIGGAIYSGVSVVRNRKISSVIQIKRDISEYTVMKTSMELATKELRTFYQAKTQLRGFTMSRILEVVNAYYEHLSDSLYKLKRDGLNMTVFDIKDIEARIAKLNVVGATLTAQKDAAKELYFVIVKQKSELLRSIEEKVSK